MSAEYVMAGGNEQVILCERGIRTFDDYTRNTLDLAVPMLMRADAPAGHRRPEDDRALPALSSRWRFAATARRRGRSHH